MKRYLGYILLLCFAGAVAAVPDDEENPYLILTEQADRAIAAGDYAEAAARLEDALSVRPNAPENVLLLCNLGQLYGALDSDSLALEAFDRAIAGAPNMRTAHMGRGKVRLKMGDNAGAAADFSSVLAADSLNADARFLRGTIALYNRDLAIAEADFDVLRATEPGSVRTAQALSTLYSLTSREAEAIPYYRTLIAAEPAPEYYAGLANCLLALQKLSDAATVIAEALESYPEDAELYYCRALLNRDRYRLDDARADLAKAKKLGLPADKKL